MATTPIDYAGAPLTSVQCPRCGQERDVPLVAHVATEIEFAGVCSTPVGVLRSAWREPSGALADLLLLDLLAREVDSEPS